MTDEEKKEEFSRKCLREMAAKLDSLAADVTRPSPFGQTNRFYKILAATARNWSAQEEKFEISLGRALFQFTGGGGADAAPERDIFPDLFDGDLEDIYWELIALESKISEAEGCLDERGAPHDSLSSKFESLVLHRFPAEFGARMFAIGRQMTLSTKDMIAISPFFFPGGDPV